LRRSQATSSRGHGLQGLGVGLVVERCEQRFVLDDVFLLDDVLIDQAGSDLGLSFSQATFGSLPPVAS